jgi:hypothetical protein
MVVLALCIQCIQLVLVLLAGTCMHTAHATITIAGTGVRFPSRPGRLAGSRWMEGYEYMARLQLLEEQANMDLCYSSDSDSDSTADHKKNFTVTKPSDGLPVVLLVSGDHCSDAVKVEVAMSKIRPKSTVSYLIIYDTDPNTETVNTAAPSNRHWHYWHGDNSQNDYENHIKVLHVTWKTGNGTLRYNTVQYAYTYHTIPCTNPSPLGCQSFQIYSNLLCPRTPKRRPTVGYAS